MGTRREFQHLEDEMGIELRRLSDELNPGPRRLEKRDG